VTWRKTTEYPFNPLAGDATKMGLQKAKDDALRRMNSYLKPEMRFADALEDWEE